MYLTPNDKYWACDIEGDLIPSTRVWCFYAINIATGEEVSFTSYEDIKEWVDARVNDSCRLVFHNGLGYDAPTLNRIVGTRIGINNLVDTFLLSMLYSPSMDGGHSLAAWGARLKFPKGDYNDFSQYTPEMLEYCKQDARLCRRVYLALVKRMNSQKFTDVGIEIEHRSWSLIQRQKTNGFHFNIVEAHSLYAKLREYENQIRDEILTYWPPKLEMVAKYKRPYKKDGSPSSNFTRHCEEYERVDVYADRNGGEYECFAYVAFHIGSPVQRVEKLLELGWEPREFTKTGNPQPTVKGKLSPSLIEFVEKSGKPEPALIAKWIEINSRANMVNTWIEAYNEDTQCIHGTLWLANTLRYKHSGPNTANIPAVRVDKEDNPLLLGAGSFTYEARDLWDTRDRNNRKLVGVDAKGIQLRVLAHYLNNPKFTEAVLDGDPHSYNQSVGGFQTRAIAKTFIYAFLLGAGDEKVGQIIGGSTRDGKEIKSRFIGNFPGLQQLLDRLGNEVDRTGRIRLCDGTPIIVTAPHTRLGYLLQGDESRIMKKAAILTNNQIVRKRLDVIKVGDIHDEWQNDVLNEHVEEFTKVVCPTSFAASGEFFRYRIPIACDSKVGLTWAQTH